MHKKEHRCGETYCKTCKDFFEVGHLCVMLPVEGKSQQKQTRRETTYREQDDMSVDEENSDTKRQVYIFFDFECTQDNLVECTDGYQPQGDNSSCINCGKSNCGVYEHKPNLCIVHKVCLECLSQDVTPQSECGICAKNGSFNLCQHFKKYIYKGKKDCWHMLNRLIVI